MNLILLSICFIFVYQCQETLSLITPTRVASELLTVKNDRFARSFTGLRRKRQLDSLTCVSECFGPLKEVTDGAVVASGQKNPDLVFNLEKLGQLCNASQEVQNCTEGCGNSNLKKAFQVMIDKLAHVCVDNVDRFESYIPCYLDSREENSKVCDARCGDPEDKLKALQRRQIIATLTRDREGMIQIMGEICQLTSCVTTCESEVISRVCGDDGLAKLRNKFAIAKVAELQQLKETFEANGAKRYWPEQCNDLINIYMEDGGEA